MNVKVPCRICVADWFVGCSAGVAGFPFVVYMERRNCVYSILDCDYMLVPRFIFLPALCLLRPCYPDYLLCLC